MEVASAACEEDFRGRERGWSEEGYCQRGGADVKACEEGVRLWRGGRDMVE